MSTPLFLAFCLAVPDEPVSRVGFTVPRKVGSSVRRNRIKRRLREASRLHFAELPAGWWIVFNPRAIVATAPFEAVCREVRRVFARCGQPPPLPHSQ